MYKHQLYCAVMRPRRRRGNITNTRTHKGKLSHLVKLFEKKHRTYIHLTHLVAKINDVYLLYSVDLEEVYDTVLLVSVYY